MRLEINKLLEKGRSKGLEMIIALTKKLTTNAWRNLKGEAKRLKG